MDEARLQRWLNGQRRSHQRTFQSREVVWQTFEQLAREQGASIDQLIGEAMESYAAARGYQVADDPPEPEPNRWGAPAMHERDDDRDPLEETHDAPGLTDLDRSYMPPPQPAPRRPPSFDSSTGWEDADLARTETRDAIRRPTPEPSRPIPAAGRPAYDDVREPGEESRTSPRYHRNNASAPTPIHPIQPPVPAAIQRPVPTGALNPRATRPLQAPLPPPGGRPPAPPPPPVQAPPPYNPPPPPLRDALRESNRDPLRESGSNPGARLRDTGSNPSAAKRLVLMHRGQRVEVDKDRFLLGRSKTQADLRLDDPNVSRQHAAIERVGSAWYIVDLGSTNGVYVAGERVTRRALADGDMIVITSHEIRCSLR